MAAAAPFIFGSVVSTALGKLMAPKMPKPSVAMVTPPDPDDKQRQAAIARQLSSQSARSGRVSTALTSGTGGASYLG